MNWKKIVLSSFTLFLFCHAPLFSQPSAEACTAIQRLIDKAEGKLVLDVMEEDKIGSQKFTGTEIRKKLITADKYKIAREWIYYNINWRGGFQHYIWPAGNGSSKYAKLRALVFKFKNDVTYKLGQDDDTPSKTSEIVLYFLAKDEAEMETLLKQYIKN
jgi:hypothetical protein